MNASSPSRQIYSDGGGLYRRPRWQRILRSPFFYHEHRRGGSSRKYALLCVWKYSFRGGPGDRLKGEGE